MKPLRRFLFVLAVVALSTALTICFPEKENDRGRDGKQFIYFGGKVFVYVDATDHEI